MTRTDPYYLVHGAVAMALGGGLSGHVYPVPDILNIRHPNTTPIEA